MHVLPVVPQILAVLLQLPGVSSGLFIWSELLPITVPSPLVLPHLLTVCSHVAVVLPKITAVSLHVLSILAEILSVMSYILPILAEIPVRGVGLCIGGTAIHECRQHSDFENSP